jgi:hypothetical protein
MGTEVGTLAFFSNSPNMQLTHAFSEAKKDGKLDETDAKKILVWDVYTMEIKAEDNDLSEVHTIPKLRNPEFMYGRVLDKKIPEVDRAIKSSDQCKKMCEKWCSIAKGASLPARILNPNTEVLEWLKKELNSAILSMSSAPIPQVNDNNALSKGLIRDPSIRTGNKKSSIPMWFGNCFRFNNSAEESESDSGDEVTVNVKFMSGLIQVVKLQPDGNVSDLKMKIQSLKRIPAKCQALFLNGNGKELENTIQLISLKELPDSTVYVVQRKCVLGIPKHVQVDILSEQDTAKSKAIGSHRQLASKSGQKISFKPDRFKGLYKWFPEGQDAPDVYRGEFLGGARAAYSAFIFKLFSA